MRYAVEGAQQSYADYKEWREKVRADREAAAKEARRAELERELAECAKLSMELDYKMDKLRMQADI